MIYASFVKCPGVLHKWRSHIARRGSRAVRICFVLDEPNTGRLGLSRTPWGYTLETFYHVISKKLRGKEAPFFW